MLVSVCGTEPERDRRVLMSVLGAAKKKALFSVGGWTGSVFFSSLVATSSSRTGFAKTVLNFATTYGFDGVDFDWHVSWSESQSAKG